MVAPSVVYVEGLAGNIFLERPFDLERYEQVFDRLCDIALSPKESTELITEMAARYHQAVVPAAYDTGSVEQ